jgi:hypothetical protein
MPLTRKEAKAAAERAKVYPPNYGGEFIAAPTMARWADEVAELLKTQPELLALG